MIPVTKPYLPPKEEFDQYLHGIWKRNWLTNNGPVLNEFELKMKEYLHLKHMLFVGNGTIALQIAIKALGLQGEVITTPYSYVATTSAVVWEGLHPVFVDIDPKTLNIDPNLIEDAITPNTSAILATHVYGNPCDIDAIKQIADRHGLKVIYDAAHCFGTHYRGESVFNFGDVSTASFHATKLFHTVEGGAVITMDAELLKTMALMRSFGHRGPIDIDHLGINGKNCEFHAAMGLVNLNHVDEILEKRKQQWLYYNKALYNLNAQKLEPNPEASFNYAYFPLVFDSEEEMQKHIKVLNDNMVFPRRYFYPSLNRLPYLEEERCAPHSDSISRRVFCLPLYYDLTEEMQNMVTRLLLRTQNT